MNYRYKPLVPLVLIGGIGITGAYAFTCFKFLQNFKREKAHKLYNNSSNELKINLILNL